MIWASTVKRPVVSHRKCGNFELKCIKMRLVAGLCPDPLGNLSTSSREAGRFAASGDERQEPLCGWNRRRDGGMAKEGRKREIGEGG